jgi:hypothetical protein
MVPGFNHNIRYQGRVFHVQTEDGGRAKPHITTLLYEGGTILARKRTSYADIVSSEKLEIVVRDLMEKQHKEMLRMLKAGRFDQAIPPTDHGGPKAQEPALRRKGVRKDLRSLDEEILSYRAQVPKKKKKSP